MDEKGGVREGHRACMDTDVTEPARCLLLPVCCLQLQKQVGVLVGGQCSAVCPRGLQCMPCNLQAPESCTQGACLSEEPDQGCARYGKGAENAAWRDAVCCRLGMYIALGPATLQEHDVSSTMVWHQVLKYSTLWPCNCSNHNNHSQCAPWRICTCKNRCTFQMPTWIAAPNNTHAISPTVQLAALQ